MKISKEIFNIETDVRVYIHENGKLVRFKDYGKNTIVNSGRRSILDRMKNTGNTNEGIITYGAVGTSGTVTVSDTTLNTELARALIVANSCRRTDQTLTMRVFFDTTEATGSLKEFGWFGGAASAVADSGTLFNHILIDETVTDSQTITIEQDFTW